MHYSTFTRYVFDYGAFQLRLHSIGPEAELQRFSENSLWSLEKHDALVTVIVVEGYETPYTQFEVHLTWQRKVTQMYFYI